MANFLSEKNVFFLIVRAEGGRKEGRKEGRKGERERMKEREKGREGGRIQE